MNKRYFATQNKSRDITLKSGSGGMFFALSEYVLERKGAVYGAVFTDDFRNVEIVRVDKLVDIDKLLTSKYLMSSVSKSFSAVKEDLESGRLVLYSGLPCQIHALRHFLGSDYENLICVEIVCHGTLPANIWRDYLQSINPKNKKIISINMRDKRLGWNNYGMSIKYEDGTEFFERHQDNKYMKTFLSDKYLNKSCYDCKFKNELSKADLSIGDFWGASDNNTPFDKKLGINVVIAHTEKGLDLLNKINVDKVELDKALASKYNGGMSNKINTTPSAYSKSLFYRNNKVAILTLNFNDNIGGVLQSYALQKFLSNNYYDATTIQSHDYWHHLSFVKKLKCRTVTDFSKIKDEYQSYIVGSDQVWRRDFISGKWAECWKTWKPLFLDFTKGWDVRRIAYSASYGNDNFDFKDVLGEVKSCLKRFDAISMRELDATEYISTLTTTPTTTTCDPTMLLTKEDYMEICKDIPVKDGELFTYILDRNDNINSIIAKSNKKIMSLKPNSVEDWLACYRDCKCVITDSFHGVVFAIIFNKPFICICNKGRGGSRFDTLAKLFNVENRMISGGDVNYKLLDKNPDVDYTEIVKHSKKYLLDSVEIEKERSMTKTNPVFGIISWFPDKEPERTQRIERLNKMLKQLTDIFGEEIHFMIVAQNWKDYKLPEEIKNVSLFKYSKLGILGARKTLGKHFLESEYDYLIMCDDDIVLETSGSFNKDYFFGELDKHPNGFVFLQYGWSLTFCAISKFIYAQSPMCDIDPEKAEGYEDTVWPFMLHYKHPKEEFKLEGVKFVQHTAAFKKDHKSTWDSNKINHKRLTELTHFYVERFKKGDFTINSEVKEKAKIYVDRKAWVDEALYRGWINKEDVDKYLNF